MKRITAAVMAVCMAASLMTACGNISDKSSSSGGDFNNWELVEPKEGDEDYELGSYRVSPDGVKLYFTEEEYPKELVLTLEKYFRSIEKRDFNAYKECVFPSYIEKMEAHLQKEFQYGLEKSFETQCDNLSAKAGEGFTVSRIKVEKPISHEDESQSMDESKGVDEFLDNLDEFFGEDYKSSVKADSDSLRYMTFYVMAKDKDGKEKMIISEYYILFAEKDGKYYTFG